MNRRFASIVAPLALAILLQGVTSFAAPAVPAKQGDADEAQALKITQMKLAALANEGAPETPSAQAGTQKVVEKKKVVRAAKKRHASKARHKGKAKSAAKVKGVRMVTRRMTQGEVQGVLSTTRDFSGSDLSGLNLIGVDLRGAKFNRANLHSANLERADLAETDLELADLTGANLRGATLNQARLRGTRMAGAKMEGAVWIDRTVCREGSVGSCIE